MVEAVKVSQEAHQIDYHSVALGSLRVKILDILCSFRDLESAKLIENHLQNDLDQGVILPQEDKILSNISLAQLSALYSPDYQKALRYGNQALKLIKAQPEMYEEKIRLMSNLIQYHSLTGNLEAGKPLVKKGQALFALSKSVAYNALFVFANSLYLLEQGEAQKAIEVITAHKTLLDKPDLYPPIRFYILNQGAQALIKQGNFKQAQETLKSSEKYGLEFYTDRENSFFANLDVLKAACCLAAPQAFENSQRSIKKALKTYKKVFRGEDKHRNQSFAHLILGKLYHLNERYPQAKIHYLVAETIFDKILQNKKIADVRDLYKCLMILGKDAKDEALTQTYFKKRRHTFGLDRSNTKAISVYRDDVHII